MLYLIVDKARYQRNDLENKEGLLNLINSPSNTKTKHTKTNNYIINVIICIRCDSIELII